jgi:hypothetical protein
VTLSEALDRIKYKETRQVVQRARLALEQGVGAPSPAAGTALGDPGMTT